MERIDINNINAGLNFEKIHKDSFIDIRAKLLPPPIAISIGMNPFNSFPCRFATYGNFSCIVGGSKAKKTYLKSLLIASYIGGKSIDYAPAIKSHRTSDKFIIDVDTEQSDWDAQRVFKRVESLTGGLYKNYKPFYLRKYDYKERLQFVEWLLMESQYKNNIGLLSIDGIADLVSDVNDLEQSNNLTQKLLDWTDKTKCHIITVLHKNFGTTKPTGHLGSSVLKKAETVAMVDKDEADINYSNVNFDDYTRGGSIDNFAFRINEEGLPIVDIMKL